MDETNPAQPADQNPQSSQQQQQQQQPAPAPVARKRRRRWPWIIGGILLALILLVALLPTLISTGPGKSFLVGKVNDSLNGKLDIANLSIGWTSGVRLEGV